MGHGIIEGGAGHNWGGHGMIGGSDCCPAGERWYHVFCFPAAELIILFFYFFVFFFVFFCLLLLLLLLFLGPLPRHMEVPRLGVESELEPPAYARATATRDPSRVCNLLHSSRQCRIVNPLSKARDRTRNLMVLTQIR